MIVESVHKPGHDVAEDGLVAELSAICGASNVLTGGDMDRYAMDWRGQYPSQPRAVVRPGSTEEVSALLRLASARQLPVVPFGGNTGLVGGTQSKGGLVVSLERMTRIRALDLCGRTVAVDAGLVVAQLNQRLEPHGVRFPLSFGAEGSALIGGVLSTNAGGANVLAFGMTRALCLGLEVVLPDGQVLDDMVALRKNNTGYDLKQLFIGAEGTLGIITGAVLTLVDRPLAHATALVATDSIAAALDVLHAVRQSCGVALEAFEVMPRSYIRQLRACGNAECAPLLDNAGVAILIELASSAPEDCTAREDGALPLETRLARVIGDCMEAGRITDAVMAKSAQHRENLWQLREIAPELTVGRTPVVAADVSVPLDRIAEFEQALEAAVGDADPTAQMWCVGHLGDGNLHVVVVSEDKSAGHLDSIRAIIDRETMWRGGSCSAEHGIGVQKLGSMARYKSPVALDLMRGIKAVLDPLGIMNPGKVIPRAEPKKINDNKGGET